MKPPIFFHFFCRGSQSQESTSLLVAELFQELLFSDEGVALSHISPGLRQIVEGVNLLHHTGR